MQVTHINTGTARPLRIEGRSFLSAIAKTPVAGSVRVTALGLAGDEQADPSVHGGLSKAVYAYPGEHLAWWAAQRQAHGVAADLFGHDAAATDNPTPADDRTPGTALPPGSWARTSACTACWKPTPGWATSCTLPTVCCA